MAQDTDPTSAPPAGVATGADEGDASAGENGAAGEAPGKSPPDGTAPTRDSPFDYTPSEQISEDLSVSFPVDI